MNLKDLWIGVLKELATELDRAKLITWFKNTAVLSAEGGILKVGLPLPFFLGWHSAHFAEKTLVAAQKINPELTRIEYEVDLSLADGDPRVVDLLEHFPKENEARKLPKSNEQKTRTGVVSKQLNAKYTLSNFITSPENRLAHAACQNVAKYPGENYNPLFIHGGVGLGKTHLLQAVANEMKRNNPNAFVVYMTSENFTNEVVWSIQNKGMEEFRKRYRKVDAFIIDDIQFLANKERSEEEFFHTFNTLYELGSQIILSSDRRPQELTLMSERLVSRFESGMTVEVKMPDFETRLAILQQKLHESQIFMNQEVLDFIAGNVTHSIRALEGVITQAMAHYELAHTAPTVKSVSEMLRLGSQAARSVGIAQKEPAACVAVTLESLIELVANYYAVSKNDLLSESRLREIMIPRQVIMYLANTKLRLSLAHIGQALGRRNHTTVLHAVSRVKEQLKNDRQLLRDLNAITHEAGIA